ncbi:MAG TPA: hypothetical protein VN926_07690, partial [Bradyrhizobium sp.]|nr:hypothetical protein [Bradyrhizobium sp.]
MDTGFPKDHAQTERYPESDSTSVEPDQAAFHIHDCTAMIEKNYQPADIEARMSRIWEEAGA